MSKNSIFHTRAFFVAGRVKNAVCVKNAIFRHFHTQVHVPENFARGSPPRHGEVGFRVAMRLYTLALYPALYPPIPQYALCCVFGVRFLL